MCTGSSFVLHGNGWECSSSISTSGFNVRGELGVVQMMEKNHLSNDSADYGVETRLSRTPSELELRFMKCLHKNRVFAGPSDNIGSSTNMFRRGRKRKHFAQQQDVSATEIL